MNKTKEIWITSFALFSLFFGAGNLLLPPMLGYKAGGMWIWVLLGFCLTAVIIPIVGIFAHAKLQGTMFDFGKKVSPIFSLVYCVIIYLISISIPSPRTASAVHEIAIYPWFGSEAIYTSSIYFFAVFIVVLNRSKLINLLGKYLTPLIVVILFLVIGIGLYSSEMLMNKSQFTHPLVDGVLEGYQTFDAIGAVVVGGVIIVSLNLQKESSFKNHGELIRKAGLFAGLGLFVIYAGLIAVGSFYGADIFIDGSVSADMQRANLLRGLSQSTLGNIGNVFLSTLITLACFTTAIGIVTGTADYFKGLFNQSNKAFVLTAFIASAIGILIGQLNFHDIVMIAIPVLMIVYPITIVLIVLNVLPEKYATKEVFRSVVLTAILFSVPDFFSTLGYASEFEVIKDYIPLSTYSFGWVLPSLLTLILVNLLKQTKTI
ncbi:branched-chain amino acid transport system II carrier protein [Flavobacteriaceae bacterium F08102]|nr:branched-chain amino acid transport system II carrier protein [Flavobacteriaceae bacterium F08102]